MGRENAFMAGEDLVGERDVSRAHFQS
jgi:hypothetical protein